MFTRPGNIRLTNEVLDTVAEPSAVPLRVMSERVYFAKERIQFTVHDQTKTAL
jgi:hypothetical protein